MDIGDYNRDSKLDIAVANTTDSNVSIFMGNGAGGFTGPTNFAAGSAPQWVTHGDINGDTLPDLVVADPSVNTLYLLTGNGNGTFQTPAGAVPLGILLPIAVVLADVNADGKLDLVAGGNQTDVLLGVGNGSFLPESQFNPNAGSLSLSVADLNGDGRLDILNSGTNNNLIVMLNVGAKIGRDDFNWRSGDILFGGNRGIAAPDANRDGWPDMVIVNSTSDLVTYEQSLGNGSFTDINDFAVGDQPNAITVADFNRDGGLDAVSANNTNLSILIGDPVFGGFFNTPSTIALGGTTAEDIVAADFNHDGKPDIVTANSGSDNISFLAGNGDFTFVAAVNTSTGVDPSGIAAADLDRDGNLDLVISNSNDTTATVFRGNGNGTFQTKTGIPVSNTTSVSAGDFNRDGFPDVAFTQADNVLVAYGNGDFTFTSPVVYGIGGNLRDCLAQDMNGDGYIDVVVANASTASIYVLNGKSDGTFSISDPYFSGGNTSSIAATDYDRDGVLDIAAANNNGAFAGNFLMVQGYKNYGNHFHLTAPATMNAGDAVNVTVRSMDKNNDITWIYPGTIHASSTDGQADLPGDLAWQKEYLGTATRQFTLKTAGTQTVTWTDVTFFGSTDIDVSPLTMTNFAWSENTATLGAPFSITLYAVDQYGNVDTGFTGTVTFTSSDPNATLPGFYQFVVADAGVHTFTNAFAFAAVGAQTITATYGPYQHQGGFTVNAYNLAISQSDGDVTADPGGDVTYTISYTNNGNADSPALVITDSLPANTTFNPTGSTAGWNCTAGVCTLAQSALAAGGSVTDITLVVTLDDPMPNGVTLITNSVSIDDDGSPAIDADTGDNGVAEDTPVNVAPACVFCDDFSDNDYTNPLWTFKKGTWSAATGDLVGSTNKKGDAYPPDFNCTSCAFTAHMKVQAGGRISIYAWYVSTTNSVEVRLMQDKQKLLIKQRQNGLSVKAAVPMTILPDTFYKVSVVNVSNIKVFVDDSLKVLIAPVGTPAGKMKFRVKSPSGITLTGTLADITVF